MKQCNLIKLFLVSGLLTAILAFAGCASTLYPGSWTHVPVTTDPPGATLYVAGNTYTSPALVWVPRGAGDFKLTIIKEGYRQGHVFLRQSPDRLLALNVPIVGHVTDLLTGAAYDVEPEVVSFQLIPDEIYLENCAPEC